MEDGVGGASRWWSAKTAVARSAVLVVALRVERRTCSESESELESMVEASGVPVVPASWSSFVSTASASSSSSSW